MAVHDLIKDFADAGVMFLEVAGGENERAALDYKKHYRCGRMIGMDDNYGMMVAYQSRGWPRIVIVDREGRIRFHGFASDQDLSNVRKTLRELVESGSGELDSGLVLKDGVCYPQFVAKAMSARRDRSPRLALDPAGEPWTVFYSNRSGNNDIFVRHKGDDGSFVEATMTISEADDYAPDCVFDSSGTFWVVWCSDRGGRYDIYARAYSDGAWSELMQITRSDDDAMRPRIAAGNSGDLVVTYYKWAKMGGTSRDRNIFARRYDAAAQMWGRETEISPHKPEVEDHTDPDVAIDGDGNAWIVWSYDYHPSLFGKPLDTDQPSVFAAKFARDNTVSEAKLVGTVGRHLTAVDLFPSVAFDVTGTLWCAWDAFDMSSDSGRAVRLAKLVDDKFSAASEPSDAGSICSTPELISGRDGAVVAVWSEKKADVWTGKASVLRDGRQVVETTIEAGSDDVRFPQVSQSADGRTWIVYERSSETGSTVEIKEITNELRAKTN